MTTHDAFCQHAQLLQKLHPTLETKTRELVNTIITRYTASPTPWHPTVQDLRANGAA